MTEHRVTYTIVETALGSWLAAGTEEGLAFLGFEGAAALPALERWCARHDLGAPVAGTSPLLADAARQLNEYAAGARTGFDLPLDLRGTAFELRVWSELRRIPFGETIAYAELARRVGDANAARAVGGANGRNPLPVVVPCHRVVAASGMGGFSGGLDVKERLLAHEGALLFG